MPSAYGTTNNLTVSSLAGRHAVTAGEALVRKREIGEGAEVRLVVCLRAVGDFSDNLHIGLSGKDRRQAIANDRMVIDQENADS